MVWGSQPKTHGIRGPFARTCALVYLWLAATSLAATKKNCFPEFTTIGRAIGRPLAPVGSDRTTHPTGRYLLAKKILERQKTRLTPDEYQHFLDWYQDHFFSDRGEALEDNASSEANRLMPSTRYRTGGEDPFAGYQAARARIEDGKLADMDVDFLNLVHQDILTWRNTPRGQSLFGWLLGHNSERTAEHYIGKTRKTQVGFVISDRPLKPGKIRRPTTGEPLSESPTDLATISDHNPYLSYRPDSDGYGWVSYLAMSRWRVVEHFISPAMKERLLAMEKQFEAIAPPDLAAEEEKLLAQINKEVREQMWPAWDKILTAWDRGKFDEKERDRKLEELGARLEKRVKDRFEYEKETLAYKTLRLDRNDPELKALRADFIREVFETRWKQVKADLKGAKTQEQVVDLVSDFYYDFVSIHPYGNGNGRMGRLLAEKLLDHYNLPPPLWSHLGEDVLLAKNDFRKLFRDAVAISKQFHTDLDRITEAELPHGAVGIGFMAPALDPQTAAKYPIDADEFLAWIAASNNQTGTMTDLLDAFQKWKQSQTYLRGAGTKPSSEAAPQGAQHAPDWVSRRPGDNRGIRLPTALFMGTFLRRSPNQASFDAKLDRYYSTGKVTRSVERDTIPSDRELLEAFSQRTPFTSGAEDGTPHEALSRFATTLVRDPSSLQGPPEGWFGPSGYALTTGIVRTYWDRVPATESSAEAIAEVTLTARRREIATIDTGRSTAVIAGQASTPADRMVLHAGGIDFEAVTRVEARDLGTTRRRVAERLTFNTVRLDAWEGGIRTSTQTWRMDSRGNWTPLTSGRTTR